MGGRDWHRVNSIICVCAKEGGKGERAAEERGVFTCQAASTRHTTAFKSDTAAGGKAGQRMPIVFLAPMKTLAA